jgi:hypothetical protein
VKTTLPQCPLQTCRVGSLLELSKEFTNIKEDDRPGGPRSLPEASTSRSNCCAINVKMIPPVTPPELTISVPGDRLVGKYSTTNEISLRSKPLQRTYVLTGNTESRP